MEKSLMELSRAATEKMHQTWRAKAETDLGVWLALFQVVRFGKERMLKDLIQLAEKKYLSDVRVRIALADYHASRGQWERVLALLEQISIGDLHPNAIRHHAHILGIAQICAGNFRAAFELINHATSCEGACDLDLWLDLASFAVRGADDSWQDPHEVVHRQILAAISKSDQHLANADYEAIIKTLDQPQFAGVELQSSARLCSAIMEAHPAHASVPARKAWLVADYCATLNSGRPFPNDIPLPETMRWSKEKLKQVGSCGDQWLLDWIESRIKGEGRETPDQTATKNGTALSVAFE